MADNHGNFTDDTSDEISITYRGLNIPNEEDENDEGIAEYLDLDLENAIVVEEEHQPQESPATPISSYQTSVLRSNCNLAIKSKTTRTRPLRVKSTTHVPRRSARRSSAVNNSTRRATKTSATSNNLEAANVHAALDEINAKLAASVNAAQNIVDDRNTGISANSYEVDSAVKADSDSVDLFFRSMAQTVMTLPAATQARIKMDICKVIATAEMKYSAFDATHGLRQG